MFVVKNGGLSMKCFESEHYIFHYGAGTKAEQDIAEIAAYQERCFRYICAVLRAKPDFKIDRPHCPAITEGLAMYFDRKWWGITNLDWTGYFIKTGRYIPFDRPLDRECFFQHPDTITYPIVGAFTEWLIATYGIESYLLMYAQQDIAHAMREVYGQTPEELDCAFSDYVDLFKIDSVLEQRMEALLGQ